MSRQLVRTHFPQTRLHELAARAGGITKGDAIESANKSIESMRGQADRAILDAMAAIEKIVNAARGDLLPAHAMSKVLRHADQIVTLTGTFGYDALDRVMKSLCDVAAGLIRAGLNDRAPILVHAQSMRLMAPGNASLSPGETDSVLGELAKILTHYRFEPLAALSDDDDAPDETAQ